MVFSGKKTGGGDNRETVNEDMEKLKPLHNFNLPDLKWGNQKLLRCMNVDSSNQSPESDGGGAVMGTRRKDSEFEQRRFRSGDADRKTESNCNVSSPEKVTARIGVAGDGEISATREKLMSDFQKEVGEMKDAILGERPSHSPAERPWSLRTRRAACKAPRSPANGVNRNGDVLKPNSSPESKYPKLRHTSGVEDASTRGEKRERPKFSISVSRRELEEDFMAMAGRRLPRKPKKRPRVVQRQLDTLFPGWWLSEITADLYKVPDEGETGKR